MKKHKDLLVVIAYVVLTGLMIAGSYWLISVGDYRTEKTVRNARMIDTNSKNYNHKGVSYTEFSGYFVDQQTGNKFFSRISEPLYNQFEKGGNKPIETSWPLSIDDIEENSTGLFHKLIGWCCMVISVISGLVLFGSIFLGVRQFKDNEPCWFNS